MLSQTVQNQIASDLQNQSLFTAEALANTKVTSIAGPKLNHHASGNKYQASAYIQNKQIGGSSVSGQFFNRSNQANRNVVMRSTDNNNSQNTDSKPRYYQNYIQVVDSTGTVSTYMENEILCMNGIQPSAMDKPANIKQNNQQQSKQAEVATTQKTEVPRPKKYAGFQEVVLVPSEPKIKKNNKGPKIQPTKDRILPHPLAPAISEPVFKIDKIQENDMVIEDHFEADYDSVQYKSLVQSAVAGTFGQLMVNMWASLQKIERKDMAIPAFPCIMAALMMGIPSPAFAAAASIVAPAAPSAMATLLKNVFCAGAAAVFTVTFIHPIDVVKTRIQVQSNMGEAAGIGNVISDAMSKEGPGAFYKGIGPAWLREASYTSLRLGLYEPVKMLVGAADPTAGFLRKFLAGALAGAIGSCAGNPFDVLKTKMMADKDSEGKGLAEYAKEIQKAEGFFGFYKGFNTNVIRAMVLNATKMACYDSVKGFLISAFALEGILLQFVAAFSAGFFLTCTVSPFDKCRTLLMNQKGNEYNGLGDAFMSILKKEGPLGFYKGFIPIWSRFAPTTCIQLITFEQLKRLPFIALA